MIKGMLRNLFGKRDSFEPQNTAHHKQKDVNRQEEKEEVKKEEISQKEGDSDDMRHRPVRGMGLQPLDVIDGFSVRPGFYNRDGAAVAPNGVSFTIHSHGATGCRETGESGRKAAETLYTMQEWSKIILTGAK